MTGPEAIRPTRRGGSPTVGRETNQPNQNLLTGSIRRPEPTERLNTCTRSAVDRPVFIVSLRPVLAVKAVTGASAGVKAETSQQTVTADSSPIIPRAEGPPQAGRPTNVFLGNTGFSGKPNSNPTSEGFA